MTYGRIAYPGLTRRNYRGNCVYILPFLARHVAELFNYTVRWYIYILYYRHRLTMLSLPEYPSHRKPSLCLPVIAGFMII